MTGPEQEKQQRVALSAQAVTPHSRSSTWCFQRFFELSKAADRFTFAKPPGKYSVVALQGFLLTCSDKATQPTEVAQLRRKRSDESLPLVHLLPRWFDGSRAILSGGRGLVP